MGVDRISLLDYLNSHVFQILVRNGMPYVDYGNLRRQMLRRFGTDVAYALRRLKAGGTDEPTKHVILVRDQRGRFLPAQTKFLKLNQRVGTQPAILDLRQGGA